jgi:hypothetical protein
VTEQPVTRDQLLASVHELRPGDLLVVRLPKDTVPDVFDRTSRLIGERLGDSRVRVVVMPEHVPLEHYRQVESGEDFVAEVERELRKRDRARGGR